jgi:hypothetical protein
MLLFPNGICRAFVSATRMPIPYSLSYLGETAGCASVPDACCSRAQQACTGVAARLRRHTASGHSAGIAKF